MKVELIDYTSNAVEVIGKAAGQCYGLVGNNSRRVSCALKSGHDSILRFAYATFNISEISLACSHQLVRIAHAGILQMSFRHVEADFHVIVPDAIKMDNESFTRFHILNEYSEEFYKAARRNGIKKEDARYGLLVGTETSLSITGNFQMWKHFLKLRTDSAAQWEIRAVALNIQSQLATVAPEIFLDNL